MINDKLVKALRCGEAEWGYYTKCEYYGEASDNHCVLCDSDRLTRDAAAAIEALQAEVKRLEAVVKAKESSKQRWKRLATDTADYVDVVRCKECKYSQTCGFISERPYSERANWFCADGERSET